MTESKLVGGEKGSGMEGLPRELGETLEGFAVLIVVVISHGMCVCQMYLIIHFKYIQLREFHGGLVVTTRSFHCSGPRINPCLGN